MDVVNNNFTTAKKLKNDFFIKLIKTFLFIKVLNFFYFSLIILRQINKI